MALKHADAKLDLITDPQAYLMIENIMRGGIANVSKRYACANNHLLADYQRWHKYLVCKYKYEYKYSDCKYKYKYLVASTSTSTQAYH